VFKLLLQLLLLFMTFSDYQ